MREDVLDWLQRRTYTADAFDTAQLAETKRRQECTVSVVMPALNEERTVGSIVESIRIDLVERSGLVDEVLVVDSGSTDGTADAARDAGARVVRAEAVLPELGVVAGKG